MLYTSRRGRRRLPSLLVVATLLTVAVGCGDDTAATPDPPPGTTTSTAPVTSGSPTSAPDGLGAAPTTAPGTTTNCVIHLHGKGGEGSATTISDDIVEISPTGNGSGWGGRQWSYESSGDYESAVAVVADAAAGGDCDFTVINGFSNGGAFAAKLYCRGETLGGTLVGVVVDDPVPDHGTADCAPAPDVQAVLYWTGGLDDPAQPGWKCSDQDWTCDGGTTVGIDAFAAAMNVPVQASPHSGHQPYEDPPETTAWLGG